MTVRKNPTQRVAVLIDAQNLYHSARHLYGQKVNFGAIVDAGVAKRNLVRAIAYVISTESGEEKSFFDALTRVGIEIKTKDLQIFIDGSKKADWDVGLAVDAISLAEKADVIILVSGDGDFIPLVEYLRNRYQCQVEGMCFQKSTSSKLIEALDEFTDLSKEPKKYLMGRNHQMRHKKRISTKKPR